MQIASGRDTRREHDAQRRADSDGDSDSHDADSDDGDDVRVGGDDVNDGGDWGGIDDDGAMTARVMGSGIDGIDGNDGHCLRV